MGHDWDDIVSSSEAAEILECTRDHIARLCRGGSLDSKRMLTPGSNWVWLVSRASCIEYRKRLRIRNRFSTNEAPPVPWSARKGRRADR